MPDVNKANRQVADCDIRYYSNKKPFLFFDTANVTTLGISGDSVHAMAKGSRRISFHNSLEGTISIEAQVYPFEFYAMFSDGTIDNTATYADRQVVKGTANGTLTLTLPSNVTVVAGTVFAYPEDGYGDETKIINGTFAEGVFTASSDDLSKVVVGNNYIVCYVVNRTNIKKVSFNNKKMPKDLYITMSTLDKDENDVLTPFKMVAYKASVKRNFEISLSSEGDPATIKAEMDLLEDKDGNFLDFIEIVESEVSESES